MRRIRRRSFFVWQRSQRIGSRWFDEIGVVTTSARERTEDSIQGGAQPEVAIRG